jgi:parallel beta-helix repeat protein
VLDGSDPVTTTVCACDGLIVRSGVTLDLGGNTISGSRVCVGINIGGVQAGADVVVRNGQIARFGDGVRQSGEGGGNTLQDIRVVENSGPGILLELAGNVVEDCIVSRNGGIGIAVSTGNDPPGGSLVQRCRVEDNQGSGIVGGFRGAVIRSNIVRRNAGPGIDVGGSGNTVHLNRVEGNEQGIVVSSASPEHGTTSVTRNVVLRNGAEGVAINGHAVLVDRNQSKYNLGAAFDVAGTGHTVTLNIAVDNTDNGFTVAATGSTFERNTASYNDGHGIKDTTSGIGTGGTANTYRANRCTGNGLGASWPPGLC